MTHRISLRTAALGLLSCLLVPSLRAEVVSTQTISLQAGWNAVAVSVTPSGKLDQVFAGAGVEMVTTWSPEKLKVNSLLNVDEEPWKNSEWRTWQSADRPAAALNNLHSLESGRGYLIKARAAATVTLTGAVKLDRLRWTSQSFNLTGLPVDPAAPATFSSFFAASPAHRPLKAFRLVSGRWQTVPAASTIAAGEAYWIWCGEGSEFQGPLDVRSATDSVATALESATVELRTTAPIEQPVRVTASGNLPIAAVQNTRDFPETGTVLGATAVTLFAGAGGAERYTLKWPEGGAEPATGTGQLLEFRGLGVRRLLPINGPAEN